MIIGTTSMRGILQDLEMLSGFNTTLSLPNVHTGTELSTILSNFNCSAQEVSNIGGDFENRYSASGVPIKMLLLAVELAIERDESGALTHENFMDCLYSVKGR